MNIFFGFIWKTKKADKSLETKHIRKTKQQQQQKKQKRKQTNKKDKNIAMSKQSLFIKYMTVIIFCKIYLQTYLRI